MSTPDTSPGDEQLDEMLIVLASGISEPFDPKTIYGDHYQEWLDKNRNNPRVKEAKDRLNRLIERELMNELKSIVNFNNDIGGKLPWEIGTGRYIQDRIAAIDAQLNKEETDGDSK